MAEHVWSVLCRRGCQDKETNVISLIEVIEKVTARPSTGEDLESTPGRILVPLQAEIVSWWVRSDDAKEEEAVGKLVMEEPDGERAMEHEFPIDLTGKLTGRRSIARLQGVPLDKGSGVFWFSVQIKRQQEWSEVARLPLRFELLPEPELENEESVTD